MSAGGHPDAQVVAEKSHVLDGGLDLVVIQTVPRLDRDPLGPNRERDHVADPARGDLKRSDPLAPHIHFAQVILHERHSAVEPVVLADEASHERAFRLLVEPLRTGDLLDPAAVEDGDPIRHHHRLLLIVGDVDDGHAQPLVDGADLVLHFLAQTAVQSAERLVHQHEFGFEHEGPRDGHALLLAAGKLAGPPVLEAAEAHEVERTRDALAAPFLGDAPHFQRKRQVRAHGHVRKERIVLEHHPDPALAGRKVLHGTPADADRTRRRRLEAREHHEDGRLPRTRRTEEGHELPLADAEVEIVHHQRAAIVTLAHALELHVHGLAVTVALHAVGTRDHLAILPCFAEYGMAISPGWD